METKDNKNCVFCGKVMVIKQYDISLHDDLCHCTKCGMYILSTYARSFSEFIDQYRNEFPLISEYIHDLYEKRENPPLIHDEQSMLELVQKAKYCKTINNQI
jgi:hypothetical protein